MEFMKIMDLMNYNYESKGVELYNIYNSFIDANIEILSVEQLENAKNNLLPPNAFDDERNRSFNDYNNLITKLSKEKGKGMVA